MCMSRQSPHSKIAQHTTNHVSIFTTNMYHNNNSSRHSIILYFFLQFNTRIQKILWVTWVFHTTHLFFSDYYSSLFWNLFLFFSKFSKYMIVRSRQKLYKKQQRNCKKRLVVTSLVMTVTIYVSTIILNHYTTIVFM